MCLSLLLQQFIFVFIFCDFQPCKTRRQGLFSPTRPRCKWMHSGNIFFFFLLARLTWVKTESKLIGQWKQLPLPSLAGTEIESGNEGEKEKEKEVEALKIFTRLYVRPMIRITTISTIPLFSPLFFPVIPGLANRSIFFIKGESRWIRL